MRLQRDGAEHAQVLAAEVRRLRAAASEALIGGNHIALLIGDDHPPATAGHDVARAHYGAARWAEYEAWCGWRTLMALRDTLEGRP